MTDQSWQEWLPKIAAFHAEVLKSSGGGGGNYLFKMHGAIRYGLTADLSLLGVSAEEAVTAEALTLPLATSDQEPDFESEPTPDEELEGDQQLGEGDGAAHADEAEVAVVDRALSARRESAAAAARRIFFKQRGDPYNRETIIGFPLIGARVGRATISGPLFYWAVDPQLDAASNRLTLTRPSPSPVLNSILLGKFTEEDAQIDVVREQLIPVVQSVPFDLASVAKALRQIRGIFDPLKRMQEAVFEEAPLASFLERIRDMPGRDPAVVTPVPVLVNMPRSFGFILDDLGKISKWTQAASGSVASRFVGELPEEVEPEESWGLPYCDTADGGDPLWFPEESNDAQRRVGRKARRVRVLIVQGPPGTGKSQTIANVICDLVADGKSVVVTSHTRKALDVLANKLPRIKHLAVSVLASDRESLAKLRSELEAVQESGDRDLGELEKSVSRAEEALRELDSELRRLDRRFAELRQIENEEFPRHSLLADVREYDQISPEDRLDYNDKQRLADSLREYAGGLLEILPALDHFRSFFWPEGEKTGRVREAQLHQLLAELLELYDGLDEQLPELSLRFADAFHAEHGAQDRTERTLEEWGEWLRTRGPEIQEELRWVRDRVDGTSNAVSLLLPSARDLGDTCTLERAWREQQEFFGRTALTGDGAPTQFSAAERQEIDAAVTRLQSARTSPLAWYLTPSARRARKTLEAAGFVLLGRKESAGRLSEIGRILEWQAHRRECQELSDTYDRFLPEGVIRPIAPSSSTRSLENHARERLRVLHLVRALDAAPLRDADAAQLEEFGHDLLERLGREQVDDLARIAGGAARRLHELRRAAAIDSALEVGTDWREHKATLLEAIRVRKVESTADRRVEQLRALAEHYPVFQRIVDLATTVLSGLPRTLERLEREIREEEGIPDWVVKAKTAIEAHRLSSLLRQSLSANPDDLSAIAARLAEGQRRRREIIVQVVQRRRELGVRKAVRSPHTNNALLNMRTLLGRKRLRKSFLALRDQIEYRELLKVFPCWICNIDDVARLFPLEPGLFDYVIVDEASQCPQTALLPLSVRARRALVVGDRKQLQPASARFLKQDAVQLMAERAGITAHPVVEAFDGKKSLLDVAERYREEFDFLDEHFRCDPDIIRWSNAKFYDNRLKVLTHRRNRVYRPALEVHELDDADDDREGKVNRKEAETVIRELRRLIDSGEVQRMTLGVISPYRKQADLLNKLIEREFAGRPELKRRMGLLASTADGFQGDERDIILYSFRYGPSSHPATVHAIEREEERLNVAFTRAKRKVICFVSHSLSRFPKGLIRSFLEHARQMASRVTSDGRRPDVFHSNFERDVCYALRDRGLTVSTQEPVARYYIDLAVEDEARRVLGVECDGEFKRNKFGELRPDDYQRQDVIERAGWTIHRISGRSWLANPEREIDRVVEVLESQPSAKDREISTGPRVPTDERERGAVRPIDAEELAVEARAGATSRQEPPFEEEEPTVLIEFGEGPVEQVAGVKRLWRWLLLKDNLEGAAIDALGEIEGKLEGSEALSESELDFLEELLYSAYRRGYNPETAEDLPEQPGLPLEAFPIERSPDQPEPKRPWDPEDLSLVEEGILEYLWSCRPEGRDKYEISGHLVSELNLDGKDAGPSRVNHFLYGSLSEWVERRGDRPLRWFLTDGTGP